jgi:hypothetical protein
MEGQTVEHYSTVRVESKSRSFVNLTAWKTLQLSKCRTDLNGNFATKIHLQIFKLAY